MAVYKPQIKTNNGMVDLDLQAERALKDGNGDTISSTYVKSVNNVTPDANGNVNVSGGSTPTLLWENSNPNVSFPATHNISIPTLANYKYLVVCYKLYKDFIAGGLTQKYFHDATKYGTLGSFSTGDDILLGRPFGKDDLTHVYFGLGYANGSANNDYCIPIAIYGTNNL